MNEAALKRYVADIEKDLKAGQATEHTYRPTLKGLLEALVPGIVATNEPKRVACGAPDYIITQQRPHGRLTIGYIEAKDVGIGLDAVEKSEQLKRYLPNLGNLLLTDYIEFRWYVNGERRMVGRLATQRGHALTYDVAGATEVSKLLAGFLERSPEQIRSPKELAQRMAGLTHLIRDLTLSTFAVGATADDIDLRHGLKEVVDRLTDLYSAFRKTLIPDLLFGSPTFSLFEYSGV